MEYVSNRALAEMYGPPCEQPLVRVRLCGSDVPVNKKARRLFLFMDYAFKTLTPAYYRDLNERQLDDWGYCCRPVTGNTGPVTIDNASKHSWALAVDIDADENVRTTPFRDSEIWKKGQRAVVVLEKAGFTWGGRFSTPDPHHFEVAVSATWINLRYDRFGKPRLWWRKKLGI